MNILTRFFKGTKKADEPLLPQYTRIYCIGDIHGRLDLLLELINQIEQDYEGYSGRVIILFLGDYIDRGMHSKEVIDFLVSSTENSPVDHVFLRGNHEQSLLSFLTDEQVGHTWFYFGGQPTLHSYGVSQSKIPTRRDEFLHLQKQLKENLPATHLNFFKKTIFSFEMGQYFFVHAGIRPGKSLSRQKPHDLMWIRDEFTSSNKAFKKIIVHGHSIVDQVEFLPNRIGIDTGAYASDVLTCLVLEGSQKRLIQTGSMKTRAGIRKRVMEFND